MKIVIFDEILEVHVCDALSRGLQSLGHEVVRTGKLWKGHLPPASPEDLAPIDALIREICLVGGDALFNFRACTLLPRHLAWLRAAGIRTAVWLPDDPVLYALSYRQIVDSYDLVLHCGGNDILRFYDCQGHKRGVNFPFWVDPALFSPRSAAPAIGAKRAVFLGNLVGPVRGNRYQRLAPLAGHLDLWGKSGPDPLGMHRGYLETMAAAATTLSAYQVGINIPQFFADYQQTPYDFPGLKELGHFFLPSRVVQYAAAGLPVITLGPEEGSAHFPLALAVQSGEEALLCLDGVLSSAAVREELGHSGRVMVAAHFSGLARALFLTALLEGELLPDQLGLHEREFAYRWWDGTRLPPKNHRRETLPAGSLPKGDRC